MLRFGIVVALDESRGMVRVQYTDMDGEVSYWLAVLKAKTLKDKAYWMPDLGEHVAVLIDENAEEGVVLGAIYSEADSVPVSNKDKAYIKFEDGTEIEYDRKSHVLRIDSEKEIFLKAKNKITVQAPVIRMLGMSPSDIAFEGDFRLIGNLYVEGNIHATGSIIDQGGNTNHHSH